MRLKPLGIKLIQKQVSFQSPTKTLNYFIKIITQVTDPFIIHETFNKFFVNAVKDLVIPNISEHSASVTLLNISQVNTKVQFETVTENEIAKTTTSFDNKYSYYKST